MGSRSFTTHFIFKKNNLKPFVSMKKKIFCLITANKSTERDFNLNPNFYLEISKKFKTFYIINVSQIISNEIKISYNKKFLKTLPKNIKLLNFNKFWDFKKYLNGKKNYEFLAFCALGKTYNCFKIHYLLKKHNFKLFILHNIGMIPTNIDFVHSKKDTYIFILKEYLKKKLNYFFFRFFIFLNIFPRVEIFFESSKININTLNNYFTKKINKLFPKVNLSYYKSIYHINSRSYDELITKQHLLKQDEIVFLDSGFDHPDRVERSGSATEADRKKYYSMVEAILLQLKKYFNKRIVFTLHPQTDAKIVKKYLKNFKIVKYKTRSHILKAFLVVFHESSSALDSVFLNKKMIVLQSKIMGKYFETINKIYPKFLGIPAYKMENFIKIDKKKLLKDVSKPNKKRLNYIKNYLVKDFKVYNYLHNEHKFQKNKNFFLSQRGSKEVLNKIINDYF